MGPSKQVQDAITFSEKSRGVAIETVGAANVSLSHLGGRDPKIVSLALLCRTISNFKGAITMVREGLVTAARTLTRCCYENLIWAAALNERGSEFVADQSESRFPDSKKLHVDKTALDGPVELTYAIFGQLSLQAAHPTITALGRHLHSELEGDTRHLVIDVVPDVSERELLRTVWWSCDALLGVAIASTEILGGTNDALRQAFEELRRLSKRDLEDQAIPVTAAAE